MPDRITEWEFSAQAASWINELITRDAFLPFAEARCEQRGKGSNKRRDLTLVNKNNQPILTGEIKLPFGREGYSPYNESLVQDARHKALKAGCEYFFTWNVNEFVLWETYRKAMPRADRRYKAWEVTQVHKADHLSLTMTEHAIRSWLSVFLAEYARIVRGASAIGQRTPDEKFVESLESHLRAPIHLTLEELEEKYARETRFTAQLNAWMRDEQGWIIYDDPEGIRDNLERAAKFSCYSLVNRLVFYEALLKRYGVHLNKIQVPAHVDSSEALRTHLNAFFAEAIHFTGDYETVFGESHSHIGARLPFYSNPAVPHWRELINQIHEFDFSKLDYDIIGGIFERLISPEERHKYGQFYTNVQVVDLINSFAIRTGNARVMDPGCGGGTFLVRAYARKREIDPARGHGELLSDLYGVDISDFAAHLSTINLATRDLIDEANYPQIARKNFFDVEARKTFLRLPSKIKSRGLGADQKRDIVIPPLDAVVGNPPYVRQEDIPRSKTGRPEPGTKEGYLSLVKREAEAVLNGRSDLHCYFWPHAFNFLKDDGYLCLLTSSQWLDVEYGFRLQEWILGKFEIVAVFESVEEPWFVGARVVTAATILRRQQDESRRAQNTVRFVQLRKPLKEILAHDGTTAGAVEAADAFRDEILNLAGDTVNERYRARLVPQRRLAEEGIALGRLMGGETKYYGGKWGVYLRAPDLWFKIVSMYGHSLNMFGEIMDIRRGITSGKDYFFYPKDASVECLNRHPGDSEFEDAYGVPRRDVASGKVKLVWCGEGYGELRPIESKYLEPEVHSLMEINSFTISQKNCAHLILLVSESKKKLKGTYLYDYLTWGEQQGFQNGSTCAQRASESREWYDLTGHDRGILFWPKAQQYKHVIPVNEANLLCNNNLYEVSFENMDHIVLGGILNSSFVVLSKYQFGRPVGVEGNLKTEVVDVKMMLVPDPSQASAAARSRVATAFEKMMRRLPLAFLSERRLRQKAYIRAGRESDLADTPDVCELDMADRRELDDAVLELMGERSQQHRASLLDQLYVYLRQYFEDVRQKEERAIDNKKTAKRRGPARPAEIADLIEEEIRERRPDLVRSYDPDFLDHAKPYDTFEFPEQGDPELLADMFHPHAVRFKKGKKSVEIVETRSKEQAELGVYLARQGIRGLIRIPHDKEECVSLLGEYDGFVQRRKQEIIEMIASRTADEETAEKIFQILLGRFTTP